MVLDSIQSNTIINIALENDKYIIEVPLKESIVSEAIEFYFTLEERYTNKIIYFDMKTLKKTDEFIIYKLILSFKKHFKTFLENDIWDLYINIKFKDKDKKVRVKSNYDSIRFLSILIPEERKMFYPYTTKNGKISFRINEYILYSEIDNIKLSSNKIEFSGYFIFPPMYSTSEYKIDEIKLILKTN